MNDNQCPVSVTIDLIRGKWKAYILYQLLHQTLRFNEVKKLIPDISERMLAKQLRELEGDGLLQRNLYPEVPPRVEYRLTAIGRSLVPLLQSLAEWGETYRLQNLK